VRVGGTRNELNAPLAFCLILSFYVFIRCTASCLWYVCLFCGVWSQGKLHEALKKITTAIDTDPSVAEYHVFRYWSPSVKLEQTRAAFLQPLVLFWHRGALYRRMQNFNSAIDDYLLAMDKADHNEDDPVYINSQRQLLLTYNDFSVYCYHRVS